MVRSTQFPFFKLPRELRDLVYHFLWQGYPYQVVAYSNRKTILRYIASNQVYTKSAFDSQWTHTLPEWLFINKAFHTESIALLLERSEWIRLSSSYFHPYTGTYPNTGTSTLFGPATAQVVSLCDLVFATEIPQSRAVLENQARQRMIEHSQVAQDMVARGTGRRLHVWIDLQGRDDLRFGLLFEERIEYLTCYQCVDVGTLVVYVCNISMFNDDTALPEPMDELKCWVRKAAGLVFGTEQPEMKCEWHDEEITLRPSFVDKKTTWHWYEFSRPVLL
ncbi:hypothetical protein HBI69_042030 [Parastagonospora nodorum]|nr:hypothetical protein HBI69_042030 [Parastagonospora nodorum]